MPTPLRDIIVTVQAPPAPPNVVLTATTGEWQQLAGVNHVSVFKPYQADNGGPAPRMTYKITAVDAGNGRALELHLMWFGGFAPFAGSARFADQI